MQWFSGLLGRFTQIIQSTIRKQAKFSLQSVSGLETGPWSYPTSETHHYQIAEHCVPKAGLKKLIKPKNARLEKSMISQEKRLNPFAFHQGLRQRKW